MRILVVPKKTALGDITIYSMNKNSFILFVLDPYISVTFGHCEATSFIKTSWPLKNQAGEDVPILFCSEKIHFEWYLTYRASIHLLKYTNVDR